jgi:hypothetical protein
MAYKGPAVCVCCASVPVVPLLLLLLLLLLLQCMLLSAAVWSTHSTLRSIDIATSAGANRRWTAEIVRFEKTPIVSLEVHICDICRLQLDKL